MAYKRQQYIIVSLSWFSSQKIILHSSFFPTHFQALLPPFTPFLCYKSLDMKYLKHALRMRYTAFCLKNKAFFVGNVEHRQI